MKCIKCGIENPGDAHFCRYCGHSIQSSVSKEKDVFEYYAYAMKKYAIFEGRASRKEYWSFFLVNIFLRLYHLSELFILWLYLFHPWLSQ